MLKVRPNSHAPLIFYRLSFFLRSPCRLRWRASGAYRIELLWRRKFFDFSKSGNAGISFSKPQLSMLSVYLEIVSWSVNRYFRRLGRHGDCKSQCPLPQLRLWRMEFWNPLFGSFAKPERLIPIAPILYEILERWYCSARNIAKLIGRQNTDHTICRPVFIATFVVIGYGSNGQLAFFFFFKIF